MNSEDWTEKYRPQLLEEIVGQRRAVEELIQWAESWQQGAPQERSVILYGKPGVGKTTAAHALARSFGWDVIELNASDTRTAEVIEKIAGSASSLGTFEGSRGRRLIILDEADNIHGTADRGGANALIRVIKHTQQPLLLIANEYYDMPKALRESCRSIRFNALRTSTIAGLLKKIAVRENLKTDPEVIEAIALRSGGDMRSAINDFQAIAEGRDEILMEDVSVSLRDSRETIFQVIARIFRGGELNEIYQSLFQLDETPEDVIHWIDENLPLAYTHTGDLCSAFEMLSRADIFLGRTRRRQNYRMWKHASILMSWGVSVSKTHKHQGFKQFRSPSLWSRMAQTRGARTLRDAVSLKIGERCHVSKEFARRELIDFIKLLMKTDEMAVSLTAELDFSIEELSYLLQSKTTSKRVKKIHASSKALREKLAEREIELFAGFKEKKPRGEERKKEGVKLLKEKEREKDVSDERTEEDSKPQSTLFDF
jgi:replication factor C large subunit